MIQLNYRDTRPIYEQIKDAFRRLIISGAMPPDEKLPSVRSLATELSINPNTIQRAYNDLESEGYVYSVAGKGSFVNGERSGEDARVKELKEELKNTAKELLFLGVSKEELLEIIERLNNTEGEV